MSGSSVGSGCGDDGSSMIGSQLLVWYSDSRLASRKDSDIELSASKPTIGGAVELSCFVCLAFFPVPGKASLALHQTCRYIWYLVRLRVTTYK